VDAGQVITRGDDHAVVLPARAAAAVEFPEQASGKYRKFAYSSAFGFSGDVAGLFGPVITDSMLAFTDEEGNRRVRLGVDAAGVEDGMTWSTWSPWPDVRVDSVCWAIDSSRHGRLHRVQTERTLDALESGFAIGLDTPGDLSAAAVTASTDRVSISTSCGCSAIVELRGDRRPVARNLAVNASLMHPRTAVPALKGPLEAGDHRLVSFVFASPSDTLAPDEAVGMSARAADLLDRISTEIRT
jgi:hypothetical protein